MREARFPSPGNYTHQPFTKLDFSAACRRNYQRTHGTRPAAGADVESTRGKLPIEELKEQFLRAVRHARIVVLHVPTGTGKSSVVPLMLAGDGFTVHVSQPRRLPTVSLQHHVEGVTETENGERIAFKHGLAAKSGRNPEVTYYTDGFLLKMVQMNSRNITEFKRVFGEKPAFMIDEQHEANLNIEGLHAKLTQLISQGFDITLVHASATLNPDAIAKHANCAVPVIKGAARPQTIVHLPPGESIAADVLMQSNLGRNGLIFCSGKEEINEMSDRLREAGVRVPIIPLHGQLPAAEQARVHEKIRGKVIISTNMAESSLTIADLDYVIITGEEKRISIEDGAELLIRVPISQDTYTQQCGRVGRTHPGTVINHGPEREELPKEPAWPIQHSLLDRFVLGFLNGGTNPETLPFLHKPSKKLLALAFHNLEMQGLIGPNRHCLVLGKKVDSLPVGTRPGKMIAIAEQHRDRHPEVLRAAIAIAAIVEAKLLTEPKSRKLWEGLIDTTSDNRYRRSDLFTQLELFDIVSRWPENERAANCVEYGISEAKYLRACDNLAAITRRLHSDIWDIQMDLSPIAASKLRPHQVQLVLESIWSAWSDTVFKQVDDHEYQSIYPRKKNERYDKYEEGGSRSGKHRVLGDSSLLGSPSHVMGDMFGLELKGGDILRLVTHGTVANLKYIVNVAHPSLRPMIRDEIKRVGAERREKRGGRPPRGNHSSKRMGNGMRRG